MLWFWLGVLPSPVSTWFLHRPCNKPPWQIFDYEIEKENNLNHQIKTCIFVKHRSTNCRCSSLTFHCFALFVLQKALFLVNGIVRIRGSSSWAATSVHHHGGNCAVDDLFFAVEVEHVDGGHLGGGAAGACSASGVGLVYQVCVWILLQVHVLTLTRAIVSLVALRSNNPVPAKVFKVDSQRVPAASGFGRVLVTVQPRVPPGALRALGYLNLHERLL